jgi:hypothetical protein
MKAVLAAFALTLVSFDAFAIQRYTSTSMSCNEVRATIRRDGAALMRYMSKRVPGLPLHGRYVVDDRFCDMGEYADRAWIRAADTDSCPVRECKPFEDNDEFIFRRR